ncbi:acid protease [Exidia glandulosa HHB12029]|uniref:Acid protease n=1 Tax=Exidia glandulosa HHB12029 TaxID=1314781 RepID=A0A165L4E5_EXIGL|nr:acid protease [Exidia glandulosa HHB12029]
MVSLRALALSLALLVSSAVSLSIHELATSNQTSGVRAPIRKHVQHEKLKDLAVHDQARAKALVARATSTSNKFNANSQVVAVAIANLVTSYIVAMNVGSPATTCESRLYTPYDVSGSHQTAYRRSITWVGSGLPFKSTITTGNLNKSIAVQYGSGFMQGFAVFDQVSFGGPLTIVTQEIGVATSSAGFAGVDGIIPARVVSMSFAPTNASAINGELVWGGIDTSKFIGTLTVFPASLAFPASSFFSFDASFVQGAQTILGTSGGIVDSGTTLILLATQAFSAYQSRTGAVLDATTGLLRVTPAQFAVLPTLNVVVRGVTFPLTPDAQRWPRQLNTAIGGSPSFVYLIVNNLGTPVGSGLDFILGQFFLERFYSVFDSTGVVGLAPTVFTNAVVNN